MPSCGVRLMRSYLRPFGGSSVICRLPASSRQRYSDGRASRAWAAAARCARCSRANLQKLQANQTIGVDADGDGKSDRNLSSDERASQIELNQAAIKAYCPATKP